MSRKPHLSFNDRLIIERSLSLNLTMKAIASNLERSINGITEEVRKNGGITYYSAFKAQEAADLAKQETIKGRKSAAKLLLQRIDKLERQVEILLELVSYQHNEEGEE